MTCNLGPGRPPSARIPSGARRTHSRSASKPRSYARPLAGLATVVAILAIVAVAVGLFRGSFTETVPVTVMSRAPAW